MLPDVPLNPLRTQFTQQSPGPTLPAAAVTGALGQGPMAGAAGGGLTTPSLGSPGAQAPAINPQHEALRRMLAVRPVR